MTGTDRETIERYRRDGVVVEGLLDDPTRERMKQVLAELRATRSSAGACLR